MPVVLPGKPFAGLQAVSVAQWRDERFIVYISGSALIISNGPQSVRQTIYVEDEEKLEAVVFDALSGKIAACSKDVAHVFAPSDQVGAVVKWHREHSITNAANQGRLATLSWGASEELLLGGPWLCLYATAESVLSAVWQKQLANPAKFAAFSPDAALIASAGESDRFVKIWRRLSFSSSAAQYDIAYLPHSAAVTDIKWRKLAQCEHTAVNVLLTTSADNVLRVWTTSDPHHLQILQPWASIDLQESIKPRLLKTQQAPSLRFVFNLDSDDFCLAINEAVREREDASKSSDVLDHLQDIAHRKPEVIVVLDEEGNMSAWGLEDLSGRFRGTANVFNIAHVSGVRLPLLRRSLAHAKFVRLHAFCDGGSDRGFTVLAHYFDGQIEWLRADVEAFFDPHPRGERLRPLAVWSGHCRPVEKIVRSVSGKAVVSRSAAGECMVWRQRLQDGTSALSLHSEFQAQERILKLCLLDEGNFVAVLFCDRISLWDAREAKAVLVDFKPYTLENQALCLIVLPEVTPRRGLVRVAAISSSMKGIVWEIRTPTESSTLRTSHTEAPAPNVLSEFCRFDLGGRGDSLAFVIAVDPAGSIPTISGFLDTFARDIAMSYTESGLLHTWTARVQPENRSVDWLLTSSVETGIARPALASGSSIRKAALVDSNRTELTIWDTRESQLEFRSSFRDSIRDLDWTSTPDNQSVLAVGFSHQVRLMSQLRYDYLDGGPAWTTIREIGLEALTPHSIGDSVWLSHGDLVVGTGNQLFVPDRKIDAADSLKHGLGLLAHHEPSVELFSVVSRLNGQLPVYHPQFVSQCILRGKVFFVQQIIVALHKHLKFFSEGDELDSLLGLPLEDFLRGNEARNPASCVRKFSTARPHASFADLADDGAAAEDETISDALAADLGEKFTVTALPHLSSQEQFHLADMVECVALVERHRRSMDDNASRFLLSFRQHLLRRDRRGPHAREISWRDINWAYHSGSQDILVDLVTRQYQGRMQWEHARESALFMWITDPVALKTQFEVVARNQYTRTDERNPIDCALFYLALKKKSVLLGLWRMASWHPEQRSTQRLLGNDFQEPRWRTAALKNAYVLLGRHRYEYAAAFFLLADSPKDAVNVCLERLGDLQLAIAIARVYEGDDGPLLRDLLEQHLLPQAAADGNRWLATWAFWMLNRRDLAVRALISPVHTLLEKVESPGLQAKLYLADDPALVVLYEQLREKTVQTLRGASKVSSSLEWDFVVHTARLYDRMGCDLLALDLVYTWEFLRRPITAQGEFAAAQDPRRMLRRRSSLVVADLPTSPGLRKSSGGGGGVGGVGGVPPEIRTGGTKPLPPPPPSVFEEPDANSLLANFGY